MHTRLITDVTCQKAYFPTTPVYYNHRSYDYNITSNHMRETIAKEVQRGTLTLVRPAGHENLG